MAHDGKVIDVSCSLSNEKDYTFYVRGLLEKEFSRSERCTFTNAALGQRVTGRALICKCFGGQWQSITLRKEGDLETIGNAMPVEVKPVECTVSWQPTDYPNDEHLTSGVTLHDALYRFIFEAKRPKRGLLVVAGATGSLKSTVAQSIAHAYLTECMTEKRRPHLVTFEDPIEKPYFVPAQNETIDPNRESAKRSIDYTPRQKGIDTPDGPAGLRMALHDALRQTPKVYYVGEIRETEDWKAAVEFAGSGHLLITTTHAGSLVEAISRIFQAVNADTPALKGQVAQRIMAVIHQARVDLTEPKADAVLPAVWRNTEEGVAAIVSDGLASILPHQPAADGQESSIGRQYFVNRLSAAAEGLQRKWKSESLKELRRIAFEMDLAGV